MAMPSRSLMSLIGHPRLWPEWGVGHWTRFCVFGGLLLIGAPLIALWLGNASWVANCIYWATGAILLIYTIETQAMRLELVRQNEIAVQPSLMATIEVRRHDQLGADRPHLLLRNIGRGTALFVRVHDLELEFEPGKRDTLHFDYISFIEPGKDAALHIIFPFRSSSGEVRMDRTLFTFANYLDPQSATNIYKVTVSYEDIHGREYESIIQMGRDGIRLLNHGKRPRMN